MTTTEKPGQTQRWLVEMRSEVAREAARRAAIARPKSKGQKPLEGEDLVEVCMHCVAVVDNPRRGAALRAEAQRVFDAASDVMLYQNVGRKWSFYPMSLSVKGFYTRMVAELVDSLPDDVKDAHLGEIEAAKVVARCCDNDTYCMDFRQTCHDALLPVLAALKQAPDGTPRLEVVT
jgi:hypothetical protein